MQKYCYCKNNKARELKWREKNLHHPLCVTLLMSHFRCHMWHITRQITLLLQNCNFKTEFITPCVLMWHVMCHMSPVTYQMSHVTCHMSHVACHMSHVICRFFFGKGGEAGGVGKKLLHLVDGGSVINWAHPVYFWFELPSWSTVILLTVLRI